MQAADTTAIQVRLKFLKALADVAAGSWLPGNGARCIVSSEISDPVRDFLTLSSTGSSIFDISVNSHRLRNA